MLVAVLIFSLLVTCLCCYTTYIIQKERDHTAHHVFVTLLQQDKTALKRPVLGRHFFKKKPIIPVQEVVQEVDIIDHDSFVEVVSPQEVSKVSFYKTGNSYPIAPRKVDVRA